MDSFSIIKSLHIIFMVSWFAGLFYIIRLFIYHVEANEKPENERVILISQFKMMEKKLWYIITWPAMILTIIFGVWMLYLYGIDWLRFNVWMHVKLLFVVVLVVYHMISHKMFLNLQNDQIKYTSIQLRIWNEVATMLLVIIVFIVVMKSALNWLYGVIGFFALGIALMMAIKWYKKLRKS